MIDNCIPQNQGGSIMNIFKDDILQTIEKFSGSYELIEDRADEYMSKGFSLVLDLALLWQNLARR